MSVVIIVTSVCKFINIFADGCGESVVAVYGVRQMSWDKGGRSQCISV